MADIKAIIEGIVSQGKMVGSRGHAFRASSSSNASRSDTPARHDHGVDIGASRNYAHEKAAKDKASERAREREQEVEKRNKEAQKRQKEVSKMANEEEIVEAKGKWVPDRPMKVHVANMEKRDTADLKGMHDRWSSDHRDKKSDPSTSERLLAVHHVLKKRGESPAELPQHKNLGMMRFHEETNTEKRMKIKNVARIGDPEPTSEKSTLSKTGQIKTKIIEEKPTMSVPNFGLSASLIAAARQIVEKKNDDDKMTGGKTQVIVEPETNDKIDEGQPKKHTVPTTDKHKKLAALAHPKDKITHKDVLVGRGVINKEELSSKEKMKRGMYNKEEVEQVDELEKKTLGSYITKVASLPPEKVKPSREAGIEKAAKKYKMKEGVELSAEEQARIAEIAKSFQAEIDEAAKKSVPSATTTVSSPVRGPNQDQSGVGTTRNVADYTISDSKKMRKEEAELHEGVELKPSEFHAVRTGKKSVEGLAKDKNAAVGKVRGEYNLHSDHWSKGEAHYNKTFGVKEEVEQIDELKSSTLMTYKRKAQNDVADRNRRSREDAYSSPEDAAKNRSRNKFIKKADDKLKARGQHSYSDNLPPKPKMPPRAARRMMSDSYSAILNRGEVELDEVSDELKKSYVRSASKDASLANMAKRHSGSETERQAWGSREKRRKIGLSMALKKEEAELEEGRGRPRKNPLPDGKETEGDDTHKHPMQQLEKISHAIEGNEPHFEHKDGSKSNVGKHLAKHIVAIHNSMRTSQEKDNFAQKVHANRASMKAEVSKHF